MAGEISGHTSLYILIGDPVEHSGSPAIYNYSFERTGIDSAYVANSVKEEELPEALQAIRTLKIKGANVTMPCKIAAAQQVDELSVAARIIGAVNTIVNENGTLVGHNTDGLGYVGNLKDQGITLEGKKMTILGAGGAGTAIQVQCALDGVREISVFNPKDVFFDRALEIAEKIKQERPDCVINVYDLADKDRLRQEIAESDILANATRVGMGPFEDQTNIEDLSLFRPDLIVTDVVYSPKETRMIKEAKAQGCLTVGGTGMLLWQAVEAFRLYTGEELPLAEVREKFF